MNACDKLLVNATTLDAQGNQLLDQAIAIQNGIIAWCGPQVQLPTLFTGVSPTEDCQGQLITPGLIDCHTHLVYAGNRSTEFQMKLAGVSYAEIAKAGGGILSTVYQTRAASEEELIQQSLPRILALRADGVTTVEIKSGYGLDLANELKMLRVARRLGELTGLRVRKTFLGAHAIAPEFKGNSQTYVDVLCQEMLPALSEEQLADAVDVFCESIAFSLKQTEQIFNAARELNLPVKCHAEQLSNLGASQLAAEFGALSCDHLEFLDAKGASAMAEANTVAVLLPGAYYFLREKQKPPVEVLRRAGVRMAVATDCNPGSSPTASLRLMMSMACHFFSLSVPETLLAVTSHAARALGLQNEVGSIAKGMKADLLWWSVSDSAALCYYFAYPLPHRMMIAGQWVSPKDTYQE
ncbi:imidazolonepropionase [Fluoribacter dumoffii]|uniref:Imidazolonepropionase n=1 Tax=Fluoribacter dumoffii TaxID=463 RepID=A0A377G7H5_9GAMM|nr:imidazolonepropionase [Fluoribacter dumoffii]KTC89660.1 imidazolone-5-propionate hydrolase [Fluoribacter dumoffii NY 23]MCW8384854.1 imidazolonepropionase [Fluoribacter dumoffii]MCW8417916.1 imidazolonepropionase [Fluoribacter dumoffii]MCW8454242.1 imidazolonepropionase [Fluoribacter dumoffii]MCW8461684.1 imidazolonepropionase [Fluoribacter dumoffii]